MLSSRPSSWSRGGAASARLALLIASLWLVAPVRGAEAKGVPDYVMEAEKSITNGDLNSALLSITKALELDSKNPQIYFSRAQILAGLRRHAESAADYTRVLAMDPTAVQSYQNRGVENFKLAKFKESVADFDRYLEKARGQRPYHWQRGIALYYAGDFAEGRKQFELHQTVNPSDVENAVWHFLCVARLLGVEQARALLIPIKGDTRVPMQEVHALFAGKLKPEEVMEAARAGKPKKADLEQRVFYANLYLGLYYEALGDAVKARDHIFRAAEKYAEYEYMGDVARVHALVLAKAVPAPIAPAAPPKP